jgi:hypothetical protein
VFLAKVVIFGCAVVDIFGFDHLNVPLFGVVVKFG